SRGSYQRAGVWPRRQSRRLLQFDDRALRFELLLDLFGFLLGHAFLHRAGRAFHQVLGLLEAQVGDRSDLLDDLDLLLSTTLQDDRELGLLLDRRSPRSRRRRAPGRPRGGRRRRRDRDAELLLELLDQLGELDHRQVADGFDDVVVAQRLCRHGPGFSYWVKKRPPRRACSGAPRGHPPYSSVSRSSRRRNPPAAPG